MRAQGMHVTATNTQIIGCSTPCPYCGGTAIYADHGADAHGRIYVLRRAYSALAAPHIGRAELEQLAAFVRAADTQSQSLETIVATLATVSQDLAAFVRDQATRAPSVSTDVRWNRANVVGTIFSAIAAIITVLLSLAVRPAAAPPAVVNIFNQYGGSADSAPTVRRASHATSHGVARPSKQSRCPRGKGKRYGRCCGKRNRARRPTAHDGAAR